MSTEGVAAVERALSILDVFDDQHSAMSLHELAQRTGLYKSTLLRLCASLELKGYIRRSDDGMFRLGPTLWRLGSLYSRSFNLADYVYPVLNRLREETGECASFYVRDKDSRICLFRRHSLHTIRHHLDEGARLPIDRGSGGRVLLAFSGAEGEPYDQIRREGYYISLGEVDANLSSVAAPILDHDGQPIGALAISGIRSRFTVENVQKVLPLLLEEAAKLTRQVSFPSADATAGRQPRSSGKAAARSK
ncbi:IclR family transcriptional regulator [Pollutimonas bauzanensis]|uniref:Transcriptional regulator, IclR family n=1 Tax=Pollutimonas bauzanensis TaxID=658167 RepID=A0A1M5YZ27_9BURK|nr:IclR family transcriptional regulator [Pollutimonas bauzanensis]SHI17205.1 transcriptional regulator, IclR family [Pollutimonas bauzanensis]